MFCNRFLLIPSPLTWFLSFVSDHQMPKERICLKYKGRYVFSSRIRAHDINTNYRDTHFFWDTLKNSRCWAFWHVIYIFFRPIGEMSDIFNGVLSFLYWYPGSRVRAKWIFLVVLSNHFHIHEKKRTDWHALWKCSWDGTKLE